MGSLRDDVGCCCCCCFCVLGVEDVKLWDIAKKEFRILIIKIYIIINIYIYIYIRYI